jgi:3-oxoacyl-[acyl-carrier protein] reductase
MRKPVAIVTGGGRGIGRGIALELAASGWSIVVNYREDSVSAKAALEACRGKAASREQRFAAVQADIGSSEDRIRLVEEAWSLSGSVEVLVNNAGVAPKVRADILEAGEASFEELLRTNLQGPYFLTQLVARRMVEEGRNPGREGAGLPRAIVFVTSVSAEMVSLSRGEYCVSKAGLSMAARLWAARLASEGIPVFEVRPGIVETDMTSGVREKYDALIAQGLVPEGRWGRPEDLGRVVRSLVSGDWGFSTGTVVQVDGGLHLPRL